MGRRYAEVLPDGIIFAPLKDKSMANWIRFEQAEQEEFGLLDPESDRIAVHEGDLFDQPVATGRGRHLDEMRLLACGCGPC